MSASLHPDATPHPHPAPHHVYYGTRLSTVLLVGRDGRVRFVERDVWVLNHKHKVDRHVKEGDSDKDETENEHGDVLEQGLEHEHEHTKKPEDGHQNKFEKENANEEDEDEDIVTHGDPRVQRDFSFTIAASNTTSASSSGSPIQGAGKSSVAFDRASEAGEAKGSTV